MVLDLNVVRARSCRVCGCTDDNCAGCIEKTGEPCHWVLSDLCSACMRTPSPEEESFLRQRGWREMASYPWLWLPPDAMDQWQSVDEALEAAGWKVGAMLGMVHATAENGDCAPWCRACAANVRAGLNPDGTTPLGEATTGAGAAAGPAHAQNEVGGVAHDAPGLGGLQTDPSHAAAGGAGNSGAGPSATCSQEPTGPLRGDCAPWCKACVANVQAGLNPDGAPIEATTGAGLPREAGLSPLHDRPELRFRLWKRIREYVAAGLDQGSRGGAIAGVEEVVGELMAAASRARRPTRMPLGSAPDLLFAFWGKVHEYVAATGTGRATDRDEPAVALERSVFAIVHDACRRMLSFASHEGWRSLARAIGEPGLELEPERLVAVVVERLSVLEACKMPDDPELGALLRAAAGLPPPVVSALRDVAEAACGDVEAGTVRAALGRFVGLLQCMVWGRIADQVIEHHVDDAVVVREVLGRSGFLLEVEHIGAWTTEQRRAALLWATLERFQEPPAPAPAFLEEGVGE